MKELIADIVVVGGGPAGLAAAAAAREEGAGEVIVVEREPELGGILRQCIHNGFGMKLFGRDMTGPEYAEHYIVKAESLGVKALTDTMVVDISNRVVTAVNEDGVIRIKTKAVVLAMGCRERPRGAIRVPGDRPAGVLTAGTAQRYINIEGILPGKRAVILGSGDIGLIMARRLYLEGVDVEGVYEIMPFAGGLPRNVSQCLADFDIPLHLRHTVTQIHGRDRVNGVTVARVNGGGEPVEGTERFIECDTVLLSVGLIPENELSREAGIPLSDTTGGPVVQEGFATLTPGYYACGNALHVHDLVDEVTIGAETAGREAAGFAESSEWTPDRKINGKTLINTGENVRYVVPQYVDLTSTSKLFFRSTRPLKNVTAKLEDASGRVLVEQAVGFVSPGELKAASLPELDIKDETVTFSLERGKK